MNIPKQLTLTLHLPLTLREQFDVKQPSVKIEYVNNHTLIQILFQQLGKYDDRYKLLKILLKQPGFDGATAVCPLPRKITANDIQDTLGIISQYICGTRKGAGDFIGCSSCFSGTVSIVKSFCRTVKTWCTATSDVPTDFDIIDLAERFLNNLIAIGTLLPGERKCQFAREAGMYIDSSAYTYILLLSTCMVMY